VFGGKHQLTMVPAQVEKRIDPRIEIGGASQTVTSATIGREIFASVVDQRNGHAGLALKQTEVSEQGGDLARRIFIDGMKPDQGIENEKSGTMKQERGFEPLLIGTAVQTQRVGRDHTNV
jgi:hypothetical protein